MLKTVLRAMIASVLIFVVTTIGASAAVSTADMRIVPVRWTHGATLPPEADASTAALKGAGGEVLGCTNTSDGIVCFWWVDVTDVPPHAIPDPAVPLIPIEQPGGGQ